MKAKVTMTFSDETVDTFMDLFEIDDYSRMPDVLRTVLLASIKAENSGDQLDEITVEMVE